MPARSTREPWHFVAIPLRSGRPIAMNCDNRRGKMPRGLHCNTGEPRFHRPHLHQAQLANFRLRIVARRPRQLDRAHSSRHIGRHPRKSNCRRPRDTQPYRPPRTGNNSQPNIRPSLRDIRPSIRTRRDYPSPIPSPIPIPIPNRPIPVPNTRHGSNGPSRDAPSRRLGWNGDTIGRFVNARSEIR